MVKRFCDVCKSEITNDWYNINIDYRHSNAVHLGFLKFGEVCEECYAKIYETIANIKYGDEDVDEEI